VLGPGAPFIFCVPNQNFLDNLQISHWLTTIGLKSLGISYREFFNRISRHHHCDAPELWIDRLDRAGFTVDKWWHYFSPRALHVLEWGHYFGLPSLVSQKLFGRWILVPKRWNLALTMSIVRSSYNEEKEQPLGSYTYYVARRRA
jgi:hypothetical protein